MKDDVSLKVFLKSRDLRLFKERRILGPDHAFISKEYNKDLYMLSFIQEKEDMSIQAYFFLSINCGLLTTFRNQVL